MRVHEGKSINLPGFLTVWGGLLRLRNRLRFHLPVLSPFLCAFGGVAILDQELPLKLVVVAEAFIPFLSHVSKTGEV